MIAGISTSSPLASVALISRDGEVLASSEELSPMRASGTSLNLLRALLDSLHASVTDIELFAADLGPGSFTGVKVGVTLAKTLAYANGKKAAGASSFDLIDPAGIVALPSKKGEWFIRRPGEAPVRSAELPAGRYSGFGPGVENPVYPHAQRFARMVASLTAVEPELLLPNYLIEPSISVPKKPFRENAPTLP